MTDIVQKINDLLSIQGLDLAKDVVDHNSLSNLLIECRDEVERLKQKCDKQAMILRRLTPENFPDTLFIHAEGGTKDINGMPERIYVVPAYGCDWSQVYERTDKVTGPEW
jgi:hypothetical protein